MRSTPGPSGSQSATSERRSRSRASSSRARIVAAVLGHRRGQVAELDQPLGLEPHQAGLELERVVRFHGHERGRAHQAVARAREHHALRRGQVDAGVGDHPLDEAAGALAPDAAAELARDLAQRVDVLRRRRSASPTSRSSIVRRSGRSSSIQASTKLDRRPRRRRSRTRSRASRVNDSTYASCRAGGSDFTCAGFDPPGGQPSAAAARAGSREASSSASRLEKIAPRIAVPSEPPIERNSVRRRGGDAELRVGHGVLDHEHEHLHAPARARRPSTSM